MHYARDDMAAFRRVADKQKPCSPHTQFYRDLEALEKRYNAVRAGLTVNLLVVRSSCPFAPGSVEAAKSAIPMYLSELNTIHQEMLTIRRKHVTS